jgi:uncharacterized protein (TIGR02145 family)
MKTTRFQKAAMMVSSIILLGMTLITAVSCQEDEVSMIETEIEIENGTDFMELARLAKEYKVHIKTEGNAAWKISIDDILGYVEMDDTAGTGSKTITLYTSTNRYDEDRTANLCITFPGHEESNKIIPLRQLGKKSDPDNAEELKQGNDIYAVGYGYDTRDRWAHPSSLKAEILRTSELIKAAYISAGALDLTLEADIITGSSAMELSSKLNASANVSGGGWGFKGEAGASFNKNDFKSNKYEYAIAYINLAKRSVTTTKSVQTLREYYMTPEAYSDINGLNRSGERNDNACAYPSTESGFDKLLNAYGTHLVFKAKLGGRIKYSMRVDVSEIKNSYDLQAYAKMSYGGIVKADASVSAELQNSYQSNSSHIHTTISALGGSDESVTAILNASPDKLTECFNNWKSSLTKMENLALMDFEASDALIPLYELVDKEMFPDRYNAMKEYMKTGRLKSIESVNMEYESGTTTMIENLPAFDGSSEKNTLIKDVYNAGQWVGRICNEFIPVINKKERVTVIYPVLSNKIKYNMGYFVGDDGHAPAKVSWQGNNLTVTECADDSIGAKMTLYLKGSSVSAKCYTKPVKGIIEDVTISAQGKDEVYDYPIVKIFNQIWMRENFMANHLATGDEMFYGYVYDDNLENDWRDYAFYSDENARNKDFAPKNWRLPTADDFLAIQATLEKNKVVPEISTAKAFYPDSKGGVLGFHHLNLGYLDIVRFEYLDFLERGQTGYYGCLKYVEKQDEWIPGLVSITANEGFKVKEDWYWSTDQYDEFYTVRLVQDINQ